MTEDRWTEADDASAAFDAIADDHPVKMTSMVYQALSIVAAVGPAPELVDGLGALVTPESRSAWGDFAEAANVLAGDTASIQSPVRGRPHRTSPTDG